MNNVWKSLGVFATVALLLTLGALGVSAATPIQNDSPAGAAYIDNQSHSVPVGKSSWYRFDERLIDRSLLSDLGQFLTTQTSFTTSA